MSTNLETPPAEAPKLVYVTPIRTTAAKLWEALTQPDFIRQYWFGRSNTSTWKEGEVIESRSPEGELEWHGRILKCVVEKEVVFTFDHMTDEPPSKVSFLIEALADGMQQLTVIHEDFPMVSVIRDQVSNGWPGIIDGIKSLLETGATEMLAPTCDFDPA